MSKEVSKEEMNEKKTQNNTQNIVKYGVLVLIVTIVIAIFFRKKEFLRFRGKIPYGWDSSINYTLHDYIKTQPSRSVLLLTGGYQSGKSAAFNLLANELTVSGGAFVISADFSTVQKDLDFLGILKIAVYKGLALLRQPTSYQIKQIEDLFPKTNESDEIGLVPAYGRIFSSLSKDLETLDGTIGITRFFDKLEKINDIFKVCVFFHSIDNVYRFAPTCFDAIFARFERRASYTDYVPVLCELKDSSLRLKFNLSDLSVQVVEINGITNPKQDFVSKANIFVEDELEEIIDNFGAHGGMIEKVFEDLKLGVTLENAIENSKKALQIVLMKELSKINEEKRVVLCKNESVIDKDDISAYNELLSHGFIYINDELEFKFAHRGVQALICNQA